MDVNKNNSALSINNSFYKIFKTINDKKSKNEVITKELEWVQSQLLINNRRICENAVNVFISSCEVGFTLKCFISALPQLPRENYEIVADGIIQLLLTDLRNPDYECQFGILTKAHPMLLLIDESNEKMLYLSSKTTAIVESDNR